MVHWQVNSLVQELKQHPADSNATAANRRKVFFIPGLVLIAMLRMVKDKIPC